MADICNDKDSFEKLRSDIATRYQKNDITVDEFISLNDLIKEAEEDGTLTVEEVSK